jgi:carbon monoxide dehydrogenase subunit G
MASMLSQAWVLVAGVLLSFASFFVTPVSAAGKPDLDVSVEIVDGEIRADVSLFVRATRQRVWEVINDYDRAPEFMRGLQESKVISRSGDRLRVFQRDQFRFGPFTFPVETIKDVQLIEPFRTVSRLVSGSIKKYEAMTELVSEAGGTRILYRSVAVPGSVLAGFVGESSVKRETEERFRQLRGEILRREQVALTQ